ncbi:MAG: hypothetical protein V2I40_11565 [Desulfobacteraceae bacterium]|jgi:hypothetical protein|nr:hypothetical protein [Desulfobacteraceae bacterium]
MKNTIIAVLICLPLGCASISEQGKMEAYGRTMDSYQTAMRLSNFNDVCRYVDPVEMGRKDCLKQYENVKIVGYDVLGVNVAEDKLEVTQTVDVEYFFLDRYVVKKIEFEQSWRYKKETARWLLQTGPPQFE